MLTTPESVIISQVPLAIFGALLCYEVRRLRQAVEGLAEKHEKGGDDE